MQSNLRLGAALTAVALAACVDSQAPQETGTPSSEPNRSGSLPTVSYLSTAKQPPLDSDPARFNITLRFVNPPTTTQRSAFFDASLKWSSVITGDVPATTGLIPKKACGAKFGAPKFLGTIDDVLIDVILAPIDGPGNVLGAAGPCLVRNEDLLTVYGIMFFDTDDLDFLEDFDLLDLVVVQEMGHVLGFGTLWNFTAPVLVGVPATPRFTGPLARAEYGALLGTGPTDVPVEEDGGPGTAFGHWDEETFDNELMTGFISLGESPLSRVTVGSMGDLGYEVNLGAADDYELPAAPLAALRAAVSKIHLREELITPIGVVQ